MAAAQPAARWQREATHIVGFFTDLSARRDVEERLRHLLHYDELTGLANRRLFRERLHEAAQRARQEEGGWPCC